MLLSVYINYFLLCILTGPSVLSVIAVECVEDIFLLTRLEAIFFSTFLSGSVDGFVSTCCAGTREVQVKVFKPSQVLVSCCPVGA